VRWVQASITLACIAMPLLLPQPHGAHHPWHRLLQEVLLRQQVLQPPRQLSCSCTQVA
jgi:hypothetical protein